GTAMTLRLDGTDTAMGTVIYDSDGGVIVADRDDGAAGTVALVIQGNDGTNDWYYSVPVGGTTVVTAEQIKTACGIATLSLADCKIWLETTIADMAYAKMAQTKGIEIISSVEVAGMKPVGGTAFNTEALCATAGIVTTAPAITYTTEVDGGDVVVTGMADWNKTYKATVTLSADTSGDTLYVFGNTVSVTVDGVALSGDFTPNTDGTLTITNEYTTDKRKIQSVNTPTVPTGNIFTNYYGYAGYDDVLTGGSNNELGTQVTVTFSDSVTPNTQAMDVTWSIANDGGAAYDKTPGAENTFRWTITDTKIGDYNLTNCSNYDVATGTITGTVTITNKAATPVTITGTDSTTKYADTTIDVSQYFTIDTNAGTPSYSLITGTTGGTGVGTLSGSVLTVTRTGTFKIKVSTGANGIYAADEKTITLTVDNGTIRYTASDYSGTYDGQSHSINVAVDFPTGTTITYSTDGTNYGSNKPSFTNEGTYTVYYRITKDNYDTINGLRTVTINKKALTITADEQTVMWGNSIDQTKYTVSTGGLITGDSISEITLIPSTTVLTDNGTISISGVKIVNTSGTDVTGNYEITTGNGVLKVIHNTTLAPDSIQAVKVKTAYTAGDILNIDDITVTAYYTDGYSKTVTGYTTNAAVIDMSTVGNKTLTVSYTENGATKTDDITIAVSHDTTIAPDRIEAVKTKTAYTAGDTLNIDDITVTAYYTDGYSRTVTGYTTNAAAIDMSTVGNKTLTVFYTENGATKTDDITITVSHNTTLAPDRIEAVKTKTAYKAGENLNVNDITVTAYYSDGYSEIVTDYTTNVAAIDMTTAGDKTLTVTYVKNGATKTADITVEVTYFTVTLPQTQTGYTLTADTLNALWNGSVSITFTLADGYSKTGAFAVKMNGNAVTLDADGRYTCSGVMNNITFTVEGVADTTGPSAEIKVAVNRWSSFLNDITFGIFFKDTQDVVITTADAGSGMDKVYYYLSDSKMTQAEVQEITSWTEYKNIFAINPNKEYVIYVKAVDKAGNTTYVCSEGIVMDDIKPVISGIEDGRTYYGDVNFSVNDRYLNKVFLDGTEITSENGTYTIPADNATHTVKAVDKAQNEVSCTIKVNYSVFEKTTSGYSGTYDGKAHGITVNVLNAQDAKVTYSTDGVNYSATNPQFTDKGTYRVYYKIEKDRYTTVTDSVMVTITARELSVTAQDQNVIWNSEIDQTKYTVSENGLAEGHTISQITLAPSTTALTDNGTISISGIKIINASGTDVTLNYDITKVDGKLTVTHDTTLIPDRIEAVKTKTAYTAGDTLNVDDITVTAYYADGYSEVITGYTTNAADIDMAVVGDKTLTISYATQAGTLTKDIAVTVSKKSYLITDGAGGSHTIGSGKNMTVTGNGEFDKFAGINIDGNAVDENNYTAREGSTIITLKAEYLDTLSVGTHAIELVWIDGSASSEFTINESIPVVPETGDNTPVGLLFVLLIGSGLMAAVLGKKKKYIVND
ncbi:MAG: beta strand repeat-containing protein, partial [Lachnospiraceae bacterium]